MQSKINLSIQTPNDYDSMLPMHSDIYAGESPFEANLWIPLVNVKADSRSMFITSPKNNKKINRLVINTKSLIFPTLILPIGFTNHGFIIDY